MIIGRAWFHAHVLTVYPFDMYPNELLAAEPLVALFAGVRLLGMHPVVMYFQSRLPVARVFAEIARKLGWNDTAHLAEQ